MANVNEEVKKVEAAIGDQGYAAHIIAEVKKANPDEKYGQSAIDRLHEVAGVLAAYQRIHAEAGKEAMAETEEKKLEIVKKAIKALSE